MGLGAITKAAIPVAADVWGFTSEYKSARGKGNSKPVAIAKGVATSAFWELMSGGPVMPIYLGVTIGASLSGAWMQNTTQKMRQGYQRRGKLGSGSFNMTEAGYTMRQRSINAIRANGQNIQSALGNEARNYYRT